MVSALRHGAGWAVIGPDPRLAAWAAAALPVAVQTVATASEDWRCGGTWFVGVDALPNHASGQIAATAFPWEALPLAPMPLHPAQLSVIRPGYPRRSPAESDAAFAFRQSRDAAHLDGLLAIGPAQSRMVKEPHAWVLGIALNPCSPDASPLVVWDGSHDILRAELRTAFAPHPPETWPDLDITEAYKAARRKVFDTCRRIELPIQPGEATVIHRHTLHGVAPWHPAATAPAEGRIIAYFRPQLASVADWLQET